MLDELHSKYNGSSDCNLTSGDRIGQTSRGFQSFRPPLTRNRIASSNHEDGKNRDTNDQGRILLVIGDAAEVTDTLYR